ncbi:TrmB family transcriptional regulator [Candidatus Gracilibacteria bacterium]|nr:TrmB family transcriptional regulator [Candidatus Gracilibacteria bacterium]
MIDIKILENIGLSETEAKIYISLLEKGTQSISGISIVSGCNRMQVYASIPRLTENKLIGETVRGKRKYYFAENPENLENIFYEKKLLFQNTISLLKSKYEKKQAKPELRTFYTKDAMKHIFYDVVETLNTGDTYYRYSSRKHDNLRGFLSEDYKKKRDMKEIQRMIITSDELKKIKEKGNNKLNREIVSIPKLYDLFEDNISKIIYANKVAIIDYESETSFIIENKKLADFEKKIFKLLFKYLRND